MNRWSSRLRRAGLALAVLAAVLAPATGAAADGEVDGPWYIVNQASGRCLDVPAQGGGNGTTVQIWDCYPPTQYNQMWWRRKYSDNTFELINVSSGRCLDAPAELGGSDGSRIQIWDCYPPAQTNQMWRQMGYTTGYRLQNVKFAKLLQPSPWWGSQNGTEVQSWYLNMSDADQVWELRKY